MGVTIATCKKSVDLTYSGMHRFRKELAKLYSKELGEHYAELEKPNIDYDAHDKETERLWNQYDDDGKCFINFLY